MLPETKNSRRPQAISPTNYGISSSCRLLTCTSCLDARAQLTRRVSILHAPRRHSDIADGWEADEFDVRGYLPC